MKMSLRFCLSLHISKKESMKREKSSTGLEVVKSTSTLKTIQFKLMNRRSVLHPKLL